jgi:hypothetical protein
MCLKRFGSLAEAIIRARSSSPWRETHGTGRPLAVTHNPITVFVGTFADSAVVAGSAESPIVSRLAATLSASHTQPIRLVTDCRSSLTNARRAKHGPEQRQREPITNPLVPLHHCLVSSRSRCQQSRRARPARRASVLRSQVSNEHGHDSVSWPRHRST